VALNGWGRQDSVHARSVWQAAIGHGTAIIDTPTKGQKDALDDAA
jgi:hypothetical protein